MAGIRKYEKRKPSSNNSLDLPAYRFLTKYEWTFIGVGKMVRDAWVREIFERNFFCLEARRCGSHVLSFDTSMLTIAFGIVVD
jgi:hypothetical protein